MQESAADKETRKRVIKDMIKALHAGADPDQMAGRFRQVLHGVSVTDIALVEQELIEEGMPREEVHRLCDVHLAVFRESLATGDTLAPLGHPINILMEEHQIMLAQAQELAGAAQQLKDGKAGSDLPQALERAAAEMRSAESHYVREENVLFPYLEKHGITQPPAIMWMEHDQIRAIKKALLSTIESYAGMPESDFADQLAGAAVTLAETVAGHFYKENSVLFPAALRVITEEEWPELRAQFDELGYATFTPTPPPAAPIPSTPVADTTAEGSVRFGTGTLPLAALEAILNTLPVDVTFVDRDDRVRYFNDIPDRVFPRAKAVLGRTVERCHPQKSLHVVTRILDEFRQGTREDAEFWLESGEQFIHIRYFAVRDGSGEYLGCLEVMQNATHIRALQGEKRLL